MNYNVFDITVHKASQSVRVGITFESDEEAVRSGRSPRPWVKALHPYGLAASNGLEIGDEIVSINGERVNSPLIAAQMLREGQGDICLGVRRGPPPSRAPSERGAVLPPKLALAAAREEQERDLGEDIDLGQMTQRALRGIGDWFSSMGHGISQMLQPEARPVPRRPSRAPSPWGTTAARTATRLPALPALVHTRARPPARPFAIAAPRGGHVHRFGLEGLPLPAAAHAVAVGVGGA